MYNDTCYNTGLGSFQKWWIGNDVRAILLANGDLTEIVGHNIYPIVAPEGTDGEFIVYAREKYSKETNRQGVIGDECVLALTAVANDYDTGVRLAELLDNSLTGKHVNDNGERFTMVLTDSSETFDDNKYIETLLFEIK